VILKPVKEFMMPPRRPSKKDSPAKLAGRMKRRWRVVLLRAKGEIRHGRGTRCGGGQGGRSGPV
jgi:hypothetical protein